jgi:hypothetical protein
VAVPACVSFANHGPDRRTGLGATSRRQNHLDAEASDFEPTSRTHTSSGPSESPSEDLQSPPPRRNSAPGKSRIHEIEAKGKANATITNSAADGIVRESKTSPSTTENGESGESRGRTLTHKGWWKAVWRDQRERRIHLRRRAKETGKSTGNHRRCPRRRKRERSAAFRAEREQ